MHLTKPKVFLVGETKEDKESLASYLEYINAQDWSTDAPTDGEELIEVAGRLCYKAFGTSLNKNLTKVREGNAPYVKNIIESHHGSCLEHIQLNFIFADVSRVFTHELITHRVGMAKSQESLRFVRLHEIKAWFPSILDEYPEAKTLMIETIEHLEKVQLKLAEIFDLDGKEMKFERKKKLTSLMRRVAPIGLATNIFWSANLRTVRQVLEVRTHESAEAEIRLVFGEVGRICKEKFPNVFADYTIEIVDDLPWFKTENKKV